MVIKDFTKPELDLLRQSCNFVGSEETLFELRSRGIPLETIAETLDYSYDGISKVSRRVNNKIRAILRQK